MGTPNLVENNHESLHTPDLRRSSAHADDPNKISDHAEHGHEIEWVELVRIASVALAAAAVWFHVWEPFARISIIGVLATLIGGYPIFKEAIENIVERKMTMELSMTIALLAALAIREFFTALVITGFVLAAEVLEGLTVGRGRRAIQDLLDFLPRTVLVRRNGQETEIVADQVQPGDTVIVKPGGHIPVNGAVLSGRSFVEQAAITGEAMPVEKTAGDFVYAGTINQSGALEIEAQKLGRDTTFGKIVEAVERAEKSRAPIQKTADRLAGYLVYFALGAAALTFLITHNARSAISVVIVAGACGIAAAPLACAPRITVTTVAFPFGDRFAIIGDAVGSRLNKDRLYSAHATARHLAETVLQEGIDQQALARGYGKTVKWLVADNSFGRLVFAASRVAFTMPVVSRIMYLAFATEYKVWDERSRPLSVVLWKIASGTVDYRQVLHEMCGFDVLRSIFSGAMVTLRNVAFEVLFGLKWGEYGRYPTVVLKEKREAVKQQLATGLGMELGLSPDFERMYVIKIRGSEEEIMEEIGKFGQPHAKFVRPRLPDIRQSEGVPNQVGSVIRYRVPLVGLGTILRLTRSGGPGTLLYQVDEKLADQGKIIFNVAPTKDGNHKLSIYAAFDYKKGASLARRMIWSGARLLFPEFVHDVVWNHALCTIKETVERRQYRTW